MTCPKPVASRLLWSVPPKVVMLTLKLGKRRIKLVAATERRKKAREAIYVIPLDRVVTLISVGVTRGEDLGRDEIGFEDLVVPGFASCPTANANT